MNPNYQQTHYDDRRRAFTAEAEAHRLSKTDETPFSEKLAVHVGDLLIAAGSALKERAHLDDAPAVQPRLVRP
jgi:hypothetical protein